VLKLNIEFALKVFEPELALIPTTVALLPVPKFEILLTVLF
jgi:hypothetical protein